MEKFISDSGLLSTLFKFLVDSNNYTTPFFYLSFNRSVTTKFLGKSIAFVLLSIKWIV